MVGVRVLGQVDVDLSVSFGREPAFRCPAAHGMDRRAGRQEAGVAVVGQARVLSCALVEGAERAPRLEEAGTACRPHLTQVRAADRGRRGETGEVVATVVVEEVHIVDHCSRRCRPVGFGCQNGAGVRWCVVCANLGCRDRLAGFWWLRRARVGLTTRVKRSDGHRRSRPVLAQGRPHPNRYPNRCCPAWAGVPVSASPVRACGSGPWCRTPRRWVARVRAT